MGSPILIYEPEGGVPVGPVSNPPVYSQAGTTQLVEGQAYVDVVFGSVQTTDEWVLVECVVVNEIDVDPLNIWPGIITDKTASGFRLQLNGMPDSSNYYLHWAVSGINITPTPATTFLLSGPTSGFVGTPLTFTVSLPASTTGTATITPSDSGGGGTFSPTSVTITTGTPSTTFTYTPGSTGSKTISVTNTGGLLNPASIVVSVTLVATGYSLSGPSTGYIGSASTAFTVTLTPLGDPPAAPTTITPSDGGGGGTFTPTTVTLTTGTPSATFTYTPASIGAKTISATNDGGLTNPGNLTYTVSAFDPSAIAGLKLWMKAESLALSDGVALTTWTDSSSNGYVFSVATAAPIYKTGIVNGKPVVRGSGAGGMTNSGGSVLPVGTTAYTIFTVASTASTAAGQGCLFATGSAGSGAAIDIRRATAAWHHVHYTGSGYAVPTETGGAVVGAWDVLTSDWNGTNAHLWRNGTLKDTTAATAIGFLGTTNSVGADVPDSGGGGIEFWNGDTAEIIVYNSALSVPDRQAVELYLKTKYATP